MRGVTERELTLDDGEKVAIDESINGNKAWLMWWPFRLFFLLSPFTVSAFVAARLASASLLFEELIMFYCMVSIGNLARSK
jgi:hypothetical protein